MIIDPNSQYMILLDGEPLVPEWTDCIVDYWTAEAVVEFMKLTIANERLTIQQVTFVDEPQVIDDPEALEKRAKWEVLT